MSTFVRYLIILITLIVASGAAYWYYQDTYQHSSLTDAAQVRIVVSGFGDQLQKVSLMAPPADVKAAMDQNYSLYIRPDLLASWEADPTQAPGRLTSSPWPDRIDILEVKKNQDDTYAVKGLIVDVANGQNGTERTDTQAVTFTVAKGPDGWQISGYAKQ